MKQEIIVTGKTIEDALAKAAEQFGADTLNVSYEVLEMPKKGFLGIGEVPAKIRAYAGAADPADTAVDFLRRIIEDMELKADAVLEEGTRDNGDRLITISGEDAGILIGHHGDTLDALQYLVNLAANRREEGDEADYVKFSLDIENYRAKREDTLRRLARRMAERVLKYHKNVVLEPMNSYERRIIHSEVQSIEGVTTTSVGAESNRRVIMYPSDSETVPGEEDIPAAAPSRSSRPRRRRR